MSTTTNKSEQAVPYATLIFADESIVITPEKLQKLLKTAGIEDVESIWTTLFANALKDRNVKEFLTAATAAPADRKSVTNTKEVRKAPREDGDNEEDEGEYIDIDADFDDGSAFGDLFG